MITIGYKTPNPYFILVTSLGLLTHLKIGGIIGVAGLVVVNVSAMIYVLMFAAATIATRAFREALKERAKKGLLRKVPMASIILIVYSSCIAYGAKNYGLDATFYVYTALTLTVLMCILYFRSVTKVK